MTAQQCGPVVSTANVADCDAKDSGYRVIVAIASDRQVTTDRLQFFDHIAWTQRDPLQCLSSIGEHCF